MHIFFFIAQKVVYFFFSCERRIFYHHILNHDRKHRLKGSLYARLPHFFFFLKEKFFQLNKWCSVASRRLVQRSNSAGTNRSSKNTRQH